MKIIKNITIIILIIILSLIGFYKFITYDRNYEWAKLFYEVTENTLKNTEFKIIKTNSINIDSIKILPEKKIKLEIQKKLNKIGLMNYGNEYGEQVIVQNLKNTKSKLLKIKGFCVGDHLIAIEIEYSNLTKNEVNKLQDKFSQSFKNYKITWTNKS
ncbi:hypothetical protein [Chryseobacterium oryzae]|uniref:Lipoprotein n=1 Tax=Chryseobacterium oryzae TaxID=2929799 RepID=A0ABY4BCY3_9FLAO|nr:hypothetical protein [Chryseobacterium oryzae]UOE37010.1 hypothetical protein MTP08_07990 [Chryseobacterium oryzae]